MHTAEACADVSLELNRHVVNLLDSLSALSGLASIPIRDLDEAGLLKHALEALMGNQDMERCSIFLLGEDGWLGNAAGLDWDDMLGELTGCERPAAGAARATTRFRVGEGLIGRAAASRAIEHCRSCKDDARFAQVVGKSVDGSLLCVPIACEDGVLGVLNVYHPASGFFNLWHERLLLLFCQVLGRLLLHHRFTHHLGALVARKTEELEQQRRFLKTVIDSSPDPLMVIGTDYRVLLSNRGHGGESRHCYEVSHHRDEPCEGDDHPCPLRMVVETGQAASVVHEHVGEAGEPRIIELLASPLRDERGAIVAIVESARDITERRRVAEALERSAARLRMAERLAQLGSWEMDIATGKLTWSDELYRVFEIDAASFDGAFASFLAVVHPEDRERVDFAYWTSVRDRLPYDITHRLLLEDGSVKYVHASARVVGGGDGIPLRWGGAVQDVTLAVLNEEAIRESEERFRTIADHTFDWEYWRGPSKEILYLSPSCERITGYSQAEFISDPGLLERIVHPDDQGLMASHLANYQDDAVHSLDIRVIRKDGGIRWIAHGCRAIFDKGGAFQGRRVSNRDITERKAAEQMVHESEERFRLITTTAKDAIIMVGPDEAITYWNPAAEKMFGYTTEEVLGKNLHDMLAPLRHLADAHRKFAAFTQAGQGGLVGKTLEVSALRKGGEEFPIELSVSSVQIRGSWHALGSVRDITERKNAEEQIRRLAYFDTLTELPNRRLLMYRLDHALIQARRFARSLAVMFLDLDHFKEVNDTLGHDAGDILLRQVAIRLTDCVRAGDTVSRLGGDEFAIVLSEIGQSLDAVQVAEKVIQALGRPFEISGKQLSVTTSIGISIYAGGAADDVEGLLKQADGAMYQAKKAGRNAYRIFAEESRLDGS